MTTKIIGNQITSYTINTEQLSNTATAAFAKTLAPKILYANVASNTYTILDDTAVNVGGGYIVVTGAEFQSGATVLIDVTPATSVTYVNSTTLRAQVPAKSASSYNLYVVNPDGGTGIKPAGITYSSEPSWVTSSPLTEQNSNTPFNITFSATGANTYSVANGSTLPAGTTLMANGYFYGNISIGSATTYNFNITATDTELQDSTKTFSLTVNTLAPTYTATYLVLAGGGGGSPSSGYGCDQGGGGGAGGLLTNALTLTRGATYTVSVGAGGPNAINGGNPAAPRNGNNSSLTGAPITSVIAIGGGGGGFGCAPSGATYDYAQPGGSGGGAGQGSKPGAGVGAPGTPGQGYAGGNSSPDNEAGGGGGGAGGAGNPGGGGSPRQPGGPGGNGLALSISGSSVTYGGGGGGGAYQQFGGSAGPGGGGRGGGPGGVNAENGTANRGGGGGGRGVATGPGGSGGSGIVILSIASVNYPGSAPSATVTTSGANTILTFNSSGTFTA